VRRRNVSKEIMRDTLVGGALQLRERERERERDRKREKASSEKEKNILTRNRLIHSSKERAKKQTGNKTRPFI
jgi:hypothetical protein